MRTSRNHVRTGGYRDESTMNFQIGWRSAGEKSRDSQTEAANQAINISGAQPCFVIIGSVEEACLILGQRVSK